MTRRAKTPPKPTEPPRPPGRWLLQDAKARFSELVRRVHSEGPITEVDSRLPAETIQALRGRGHNVTVLEDTYAASNFARLVAIQVDETGGLLRGGAAVTHLLPY